MKKKGSLFAKVHARKLLGMYIINLTLVLMIGFIISPEITSADTTNSNSEIVDKLNELSNNFVNIVSSSIVHSSSSQAVSSQAISRHMAVHITNNASTSVKTFNSASSTDGIATQASSSNQNINNNVVTNDSKSNNKQPTIRQMIQEYGLNTRNIIINHGINLHDYLSEYGIDSDSIILEIGIGVNDSKNTVRHKLIQAFLQLAHYNISGSTQYQQASSTAPISRPDDTDTEEDTINSSESIGTEDDSTSSTSTDEQQDATTDNNITEQEDIQQNTDSDNSNNETTQNTSGDDTAEDNGSTEEDITEDTNQNQDPEQNAPEENTVVDESTNNDDSANNDTPVTDEDTTNNSLNFNGVSIIKNLDAHHVRICKEQTAFKHWLNGEHGVIAEFGITGKHNETQAQKELAEFFFALSDRYNFDTYLWAIGDWVAQDESLQPYNWNGNTLIDNELSQPFNDSLRSSQIRGINITGGEISIGGYGEGVIGFLNKSYLYHDKSKIWKSLSQKGIKHVRFPVRLERLFRTNGDIKRNDMHALETAIELAKDNGIKISIDIHNYANMRIHNNVEKLSKDSAFSIEFYKKTLRRFARLADDHDNIESISIMNEPVGVSKPQWEYISQIAVDTLREANYNKMIYVSTWFWGGIQDATHHSKPWIIDSGPHAYEVHQYFDHGHSGFYRNSYQHDEIAITKDGYAPGDCTLY